MSLLPKQICPKTQKADCPLCGSWLDWVALQKRSEPKPIPGWWAAWRKELQAAHDKLRTAEFEAMALLPIDEKDK